MPISESKLQEIRYVRRRWVALLGLVARVWVRRMKLTDFAAAPQVCE
jgi:hypothetical protein